jgi:hypothetical protein
VAKIKGKQNHGHEPGTWEKRACEVDGGPGKDEEFDGAPKGVNGTGKTAQFTG